MLAREQGAIIKNHFQDKLFCYLRSTKHSVVEQRLLYTILLLYWGWINVLFYSGEFAINMVATFYPFGNDSLWNLSILFNVTALIIIRFTHLNTHFFQQRASSFYMASFCCALGIIFIAIQSFISFNSVILTIAAAAAIGIGIALFMVSLECLIMFLHMQEAILGMAIATIGSAAFCLFLSAMQTWLIYLIMVSVPIVIACMYRLSPTLEIINNDIEGAEIPSHSSKINFEILPLNLLAAAVGLSLGLVRSMIFVAIDDSAHYIFFIISLVIAGALLLITTAVFTSKRSLLYLYIGVSVIVTSLLLFSFSFRNIAIVESLHSTGFYYFNALFWILCASFARRCTSPVKALASSFALYQIFQMGGGVFGSLIMANDQLNSIIEISNVFTIVIYLFLLASIFVLIKNAYNSNNHFVNTTPTTKTIEQCCKEIITSKNLTKREEEVLLLIINGRDRGFIAETLNISKETVKTHTSHIYAKLGIHTKQDLLTLIQESLDVHKQ